MSNKEGSSMPRVFWIGVVFLIIGISILYFTNKNKISVRDNTSTVTVYNCEEKLDFNSVPQRIISFDTNMTEIILKLGLEKHLVGYWISGVEVGEEFKEKIENIPLISKVTWPPPSIENIVSFNPDFVFGAWEYNFSNESGVTPDRLKEHGIKSYVLTESCIATGVKPSLGIDSTYQDIENLGKIFHVEDKANEIISNMKANIERIQKVIQNHEETPKGFYYGGGSDAAFTAGKYAMVTKMMKSVGAENILGEIEDDWIPAAGWETIIERNPEFIMIDDTPWESAENRIKTLESLEKLQGITAIKEKKYIIFPWTYILPGVQMDKGIEHLAKNLYPKLFSD